MQRFVIVGKVGDGWILYPGWGMDMRLESKGAGLEGWRRGFKDERIRCRDGDHDGSEPKLTLKSRLIVLFNVDRCTSTGNKILLVIMALGLFGFVRWYSLGLGGMFFPDSFSFQNFVSLHTHEKFVC